jgi:hypothetical protein
MLPAPIMVIFMSLLLPVDRGAPLAVSLKAGRRK